MSKETDEKGVLDALVTKYNLDKSICPNYSEHWKNARLSSDMMFDHDGAFLVKRINFAPLKPRHNLNLLHIQNDYSL